MCYVPTIDYIVTYPPPNYPSTSPYNALTKTYQKWVKQKIINRKLLKSLLYPECLYKVDITNVKRRHHKVECIIMKRDSKYRDSIIKCDSDSDSDSSTDDATNKICRQNAVDKDNSTSDDASDSSDESNPFGYIRYYNPGTGEKREETKYESFIDYGVVTPKLAQRQSTKPSIILTSTAKVKLSKQPSEDSEASSNFVPKQSTACENLANLDSSFEMETLAIPEAYVPTSRQSCPTKMVGNKFSQSSLTTIYIPTWQSSSDNNLCAQTFDNKDKKMTLASTTESSSEGSTTHSSSIDIPVNVAPLPDAMVAELLYNYKNKDQHILEKSESVDSDRTEFSSQTVIKPPPMFQNGNRLISHSNDELNSSSPSFNLNLKNTQFKKHSINSDKPKRKSSVQLLTRGNSNLRRCVSYKYLELTKKEPQVPIRASYCRCCPGICHSPRSSDSGMAGSCTLNSPDLTPNELYAAPEHCSADMTALYQKYNDLAGLVSDSRNILSLSEIEARNFESQCQCTSPFGSTPRTSCQASTSENIYSGSQQDSARTSVTSSLDLCNYPAPQPWEAESQIYSKISSIRPNIPIPRKNTFSQPTQKSKSLTNISLLGRTAMPTVREDEEIKKETFKSGLYAHWWMKAKIPPEVVKGIYEDTRPTATGKGVHVWRIEYCFRLFVLGN